MDLGLAIGCRPRTPARDPGGLHEEPPRLGIARILGAMRLRSSSLLGLLADRGDVGRRVLGGLPSGRELLLGFVCRCGASLGVCGQGRTGGRGEVVVNFSDGRSIK